jgi:UDP-N-acetylmuramoyl-tripeptide--D-alanyl-D-alanine ligase
VNFTTSGLANALGGTMSGDGAVIWMGVEIDTRRDVKGKVFFALRGTQSDGHEFLSAAIAGGCAAVVVSQPTEASVPVIQVEDTRKALFRLSSVVRSQLGVETTIAITGSVGKTTTKDLLAQLLGDSVTASQASFNNDLGVPLTLLDAVDSKYLVVEVGANEPGEIEPLAKLVSPDIAIITTIQKAHLEGFGSISTILKEKTILLKALQEGGIAIIPESVPVDGFELDCDVIIIGESDSSDIRVRIRCNEDGYAMLDVGEGFVTLKLLGKHNAMNAACAIVAAKYALARSEEPPTLHDLLQKVALYEGTQGRLARITIPSSVSNSGSEVIFIDDSYNANPASMQAAIESFSMVSGRRKVMILGDMLELGEHAQLEHHNIGCMLSNLHIDQLFLVGQEMSSAAKILPFATYESQSDDGVIDRIAKSLQDGDVVLLKGSRAMKLERIIAQFEKLTTKVPTP